MKNIVIIGTGGFARETLAVIEDNSRDNLDNQEWNILGFIDRNVDKGILVDGYPVLGDDEWLVSYPHTIYAACGIGETYLRRRIIEKYKSKVTNVIFPNIISRKTTITSPHTMKIGEGCIICPGTVITCDITIGNFMIANLNCTFGHDTVIGDYVTVNPGTNISGCVTLGNEITIGTGVQIIPKVSVGSQSIIGAGSVVIKDIPPKCTAVGCPAKPIKFHE